MKMPPSRLKSIRGHLGNASDCSGRFLWGAAASVSLGDLVRGTSLGGRLRELSGRSVLLATRDQLAAALALVDLDGVAGRIIICPPDIAAKHLPAVIAQGGVDAIVSDHDSHDLGALGVLVRVISSFTIAPLKGD